MLYIMTIAGQVHQVLIAFTVFEDLCQRKTELENEVQVAWKQIEKNYGDVFHCGMYALVPLAGALYAFRGLRKQNVPLNSMNPLQTQIIYQTIGFSFFHVILFAVSYALCLETNFWASEAYFLVAASPLLPLIVQFTTVYEERNRSKFFRRPRGNEDISVVL